MRPATIALLCLTLFVAGCPHFQSSGDRLRRSVMEYNEGIRWQHWKMAAEFVRPAERGEFLARKEAQGDAIHVTDFEIRDVNFDRDKDEAQVIVDFAWHSYPSLTVHRTRVRQTWMSEKGDWFLDHQDEIKPEAQEMTPDKMF